MIDEAAINLIQRTAIEASGVRPTLPPAGTEKSNVYFIHTPTGPQRVEGTVPAKHLAGDIDTVVRLAQAVEGSSVWYDRTGVAAHHPDGDTATLALKPSKVFQQLIDWDKLPNGYGCDQASVYRLFRTRLREALNTGYTAALAAVRDVRVRVEEKVAGEVDRQKTSMGRSVLAEASGPELPDVLELYVPVFEASSIAGLHRVKVAFDLDPKTGQFTLTVLPGEIERAYGSAEDQLRRSIVDAAKEHGAASLPIYYGRPG